LTRSQLCRSAAARITGTRAATRQPVARAGANLFAPLGHRSLYGRIIVAESRLRTDRSGVIRVSVGSWVRKVVLAVTTGAR
jgi:hypothetical protein